MPPAEAEGREGLVGEEHLSPEVRAVRAAIRAAFGARDGFTPFESEYEVGVAAYLAALAQPGKKPQGVNVLMSLVNPDMIVHDEHPECPTQEPHTVAECPLFSAAQPGGTEEPPKEKRVPWTKNNPPALFDGLGGLTFSVRTEAPLVVVGYMGAQYQPVGVCLPHQLTLARARELSAKGDWPGEVWVLPVDTADAIFVGDSKTLAAAADHARAPRVAAPEAGEGEG